ncbi:MAG: tRNA glutamyl-Q(34) synthetase GluQRS [Rhodobacteraceae bacterium]|nr:tRNA glutamyl-Q(34) synthetase GluQRS [Paracoccaceae bacterium]
MTVVRSRFAPSPTGLLHLGHAYSAIMAWNAARSVGGEFLLRMEDIDFQRCREHFRERILEDLAWLGLDWPRPAMLQSDRLDVYSEALGVLCSLDLCYPCSCTRKDIAEALSATHGAGAGDSVRRYRPYPRTCSHKGMEQRRKGDAIRLNMRKAIDFLGGPEAVGQLFFSDQGSEQHGRFHLDPRLLIDRHGDIVIARGDIGTSYNLAVVVDDAEQRITHVVRGVDLHSETAVHRLLQALLQLPVPVWCHHRLIKDEHGKRLAKRHDALAICKLREAGWTSERVQDYLGLKMV